MFPPLVRTLARSKRRRPTASPPALALALLLGGLVVAGLGPVPTAGQSPETNRGELRIGINVGSTGFLGLATEYRRGDWSGELLLGTITFREFSVAVSGKRYFGSGQIRPAVGAGLWSLTAWTDDGSGSILLARVPLAADWQVTGNHHLGLEVALNRALAVNRLDPEDQTPPNRTIVPLPGAYYRFGWEP